MRARLVLALAAVVPTGAWAQAIASAASLTEGAVSVVATTWMAVAVVAATVIFFRAAYKMLFEGEVASSVLPALIPVVMLAGGSMVFQMFLGDDKAEAPGFLSAAWTWFTGHLLPFGVTAAAGGTAIWAVQRIVRKRRDARQAKADVRAILAALADNDAGLMHLEYGSEARWKTSGPISEAKSIQNELVPMLEQVHGGRPLTEEQRSSFDAIAAKVLKQCGVAALAASEPCEERTVSRETTESPR